MAHILVVEDDPTSLLLLTRVLEAAGYRVGTAGDGRKALELHRAEPFDLIITEMVLPQMDGIELIQALRQGDRKVTVIAISGSTTRVPLDYLPIASALGADYTLEKPINFPQLLDVVHLALKRRPPN